MLLRKTILLLCLTIVVRIADATPYISELLVNKTVEYLREIDLNSKLENYIAEQEHYIDNLNYLRAYLEPEGHVAENYKKTHHPASILKQVRLCITAQHKYTYPQTGGDLQPFDEKILINVLKVLPSREELWSFARGILRLMEQYNFPIYDIVKGKIGPFESNPLTYDELIDLALSQGEGVAHELEIEQEHHTFSRNTMNYVFDTMQIAFKRATKKDDQHNQYILNRAKYELQNTAFSVSNCTCSIPMMNLLKEYKSILNETEISETEEMCKDVEPYKCQFILHQVRYDIHNIYTQCKQSWLDVQNGNTDNYLTVKKASGVCRLKQDHTALLFNRGKIEELTFSEFNDYTVKFAYDVVSDDEIQYIKDIGAPGLKRATIVHNSASTDNKRRPSPKRTSRTYQMNFAQAQPLKNFRARLEGLFGFAIRNNGGAEKLKIGHYGPTSSFITHMDQLAQPKNRMNDRLATIIVYLDDAIGGITLFDDLGLSIVPKKGTAVMFPLYFRNGSKILSTRHTGCPIVYGEKWIITQWIHRFGNEFTYPCSLNRLE